MQCPKCSYTRLATDDAPPGMCPRCGLVYAKYSVTEPRPRKEPIKTVTTPITQNANANANAQSKTTQAIKFIVAVLMGFCSGFLIYMMAAMLFVSTGSRPSGAFVLVGFIGGWVLSSWLMLRGAASVSKVFSRGFLLGAAEWLFMIVVGFVLAGKTVAVAGSQAAAAGAAVGGGVIAMLTGGVSIVMALICLIGFAVSYFLGKEMSKEVIAPTPTKKCPSCAELVQVEALKCRHCGEVLMPTLIN